MIAYYSSQGIFGWGLPSTTANSSNTPSSAASNTPTTATANTTTYKTSSIQTSDRSLDRSLFCDYTSRTLNASFRVTSLSPRHFQDQFHSQIQSFTSGETTVPVVASDGTVSSTLVSPARRIPFVPGAYQLSVDRNTIRKSPRLKEFHEWLKVQTDVGHITRQETVSMVRLCLRN